MHRGGQCLLRVRTGVSLECPLGVQLMLDDGESRRSNHTVSERH